MNESLADIRQLTALLRLLDDETPEVRSVVSQRLGEMGSDLSEMLPDATQELTADEKKILSEILHPLKRKNLIDEWLTPRFGSMALDDDWELFESHLRLLSDFLHDGVSLRQPLSDALDLLAEEFQNQFPIAPNENDLRVFLFEEGRLKPNRKNYEDARNSDLAWCIAEGVSNPIGLGVIFMLLGKRLGMEIEGIAFPGHFLCRIVEDGQPLVIDCFDSGKLHAQELLTDAGNELTEEQRLILEGSADLGFILMRILNNLIFSLKRGGRKEDLELIVEMRDSMIPTQGRVGG